MGRSPCCDDTSELKKGPWTPEEDELLVSYIQKHGLGRWRALPKAAGLSRCGKSCRLRWNNYLKPDIKRGRFTEEEEDMIIKLHSVLGNKWARIAAHLPGRTDNEIKNYWNTQLRKKLLNMGIDPVTHKPRNDLNLLANLSQLLSPQQNLGPLMNPLDINNALSIQPNVVTEVAKLQVLQNILQILNTNNNPSSSPSPSPSPSSLLPLQNMDHTMSLNLGSSYPNNNVNGMVNNNNNNNHMCSTYQGFYYQLPTFITSTDQQPTVDHICDSSTPELYDTSLDANCNKSSSSTTDETLEENRLSSPINQFKSNPNSTNGSYSLSPTTDDFFDGWDMLLDDGNNDFWKQFIN